MSLVIELEAKRAIERQQLFEAMSNYLRNLGIDSILATEPSTDSFGGTINEPVIKLKGQNVDRIYLTSTDYISCGVQGSVSRFIYDIVLEKKLTGKAGKLLEAKTKSIKEKKLVGLFGGLVVSINWVGRDLADLLNHDSYISKVLLDCAKSKGNPEFRVQVKLPFTSQIIGPKFAEPQRIIDLLTFGSKEQFEECVFGFKICDRIAEHVRQLVGAW